MYTINVQRQLRSELSRYWSTFQLRLFPLLELTIGELSEQHRRFVSVVELVRVEELLSGCESKGPGRPNGTLSLYFFQEPVSTLQTVTYENCLFL